MRIGNRRLEYGRILPIVYDGAKLRQRYGKLRHLILESLIPKSKAIVYLRAGEARLARSQPLIHWHVLLPRVLGGEQQTEVS